MSPTFAIIVALGGLIALIIGVYLAYSGSQERRTYEEAKDRLENEKEELQKELNKARSGAKSSKKSKKDKKSEPAKAPVAAKAVSSSEAEEELRKQLDEVRGKLTKQREKNHDITRERDNLRGQLSEAKEEAKQTGPIDQDALFDLRMELSEAKAEVETLKSKLASKPSKSKKDREPEPVQEPEPVKAVEPEVSAEPPSGDDIDAIHADYKSRLNKLDSKLKAQEKDLRDKLRSKTREADQNRKRADNNDKAYRITQRELDATRERLRLLEDIMRKMKFAEQANAAAPEAIEAAEATESTEAAPAASAPEAQTQVDEKLAVNESAELGDDLSNVDEAWSDFIIDEEE